MKLLISKVNSKFKLAIWNVLDSRSAKPDILTHSGSEYGFLCIFEHVKSKKFSTYQNSEPIRIAKMAVLELLDSPKLISHKILKYPHCDSATHFKIQVLNFRPFNILLLHEP